MTSASRPTLTAAALAYAKRGWPVFPLAPRDKTPLTKTGFKVASTDRDVVLAWWSQWPDANIGIATGHAFDVLDIDGTEGRTALREFLMERGITYRHDGPASYTGKGQHLLFLPTGEGNGAGLLPKVDFRGMGGYIVAPPSVHPLGHSYRWDEKRNEASEIPVAPDWLLELLSREHKIVTPPKPTAIIREFHKPEIPAVVLTTSGKIAEERPGIVEVAVETGLSPVGRGHYYVVSCPFHDDSTPSMALYPAPQDKFYCYGCGAHGDSHDLKHHRDMEGRTFLR